MSEQLALFAVDEYDYELRRWPCRICGGMPLPDPALAHVDPRVAKYLGADPCLGWLPGVQFACCGHGGPDSRTYVMMEGRDTWYGVEARVRLRELGGNPPVPSS